MVVPGHQLLATLLPDQQQHGEAEAGDAQHEEGEGPASEDAVDSGDVEEEDEEHSLDGHSSEHVLVGARVNEGHLSRGAVTFLDLQAKTLDHCTITMVTK